MWYVVINIQLKCLYFFTSSNMPACPLDAVFMRAQHVDGAGNTKWYKCSQCDQRHATKNEAREHAVTHDQTLQPQLEAWRASILASKKRKRCDYSCGRCGQDLKRKPKLIAHMQYCGESSMCEYCGADFKSPQWLRSHAEQNPRCLAKRKAQESAGSV